MNARILSRLGGPLLVCFLSFFLSPQANAQLAEAFQNLFTPSLPSAIDRGLAPGGDLAMEIQKFGQVSVKTMTDARAIVKAAKALPLPATAAKTKSYSSALHRVADLFEAYEYPSVAVMHLQSHGIPELIRVYDTLVEDADDDTADDLVRLLRVFALYYTTEGTDRVIDGVKRELAPDSYWWFSVFAQYGSEHPESLRFYREMSEHLPSGPIGVALLSQANARATEDDTFKHPFDNDAGVARLKEWLSGDDVEVATSAVTAIRFMDESRQTELFEMAAAHPDKSVRMEAAYGQAQVGEPAAFEQLAKYCLDVDLSTAVQYYLEQLEAAELIPEEAKEPSFAAKAQLSAYLASPDELGQAPDEMRIIQQREVPWLVEEPRKVLTLLEFEAKSEDPLSSDIRGFGHVGSSIWASMTEDEQTLSPDDHFAFHYGWEAFQLESSELNEEVTSEEQAACRSQWTGKELQDLKFLGKWKLDPKLDYPQESVALASAKIDERAGLVVFDGPRSHWYPADEFHPDLALWPIAEIHVGRVLLGLDLDVPRTFTPIPEVKFPPEVVIREYEKWLLDLKEGSVKRQLELLTESGLLESHFEEYVDALVATGAVPERQQAIRQTFEQFLDAARGLPPQKQDEALGAFSAVGATFELYAKAIKDDPEKSKALIAEFEPLWNHKYGRSRLAKIAFDAGQRDKAQQILEKAIELKDMNRHRDEDADILADLWHSKGKTAEAKELLIGAIKQCVVDAAENEYDLEDAQKDAQRHQDKYRQLFPESAEAELEKAGVAAPIEQLIEAAQKTGDNQDS